MLIEIVTILIHGHSETDDTCVEETGEYVSCSWEGEGRGSAEVGEVGGVSFVEG